MIGIFFITSADSARLRGHGPPPSAARPSPSKPPSAPSGARLSGIAIQTQPCPAVATTPGRHAEPGAIRSALPFAVIMAFTTELAHPRPGRHHPATLRTRFALSAVGEGRVTAWPSTAQLRAAGGARR
ncbi:hypothetical protein QJS66_18010 [Kocuria rhizophila]|nr:hypothetical protein QJS66_18010 [Kocuria rhizophila]